MKIREGNIHDIKGLARVHFESWVSAYSDIFSPEVFAKRTLERVEENWKPRLLQTAREYKCYLAETDEGEIAAFAECGLERTGRYGMEGELYTIYILEEYQRKGIGSRLFKRAADHLCGLGMESMMVWVLKDNPFRLFYECLGGLLIDGVCEPVGDTGRDEVAYSWKLPL